MSLIPCSECGEPFSTDDFPGSYFPSQDKWICQPCIDELEESAIQSFAESTYPEPQ